MVENHPNQKVSQKLYKDKSKWYETTKKHWEKCEGTSKGMLGGNTEVHNCDIDASKELLENYITKKFLTPDSLLEIGAGIGRVTENLLVNYFKEIYLVEQDKLFCETATKNLNKFEQVKGIINCPMQDLHLNTNNELILNKKFNCIWIQWCIENINDDDLVALLIFCKQILETKGMIIVKENVVEDDAEIKINNVDFSRVRSDKLFKELFKKAGLKIFKSVRHPNWPKDMMDVSVFVLM